VLQHGSFLLARSYRTPRASRCERCLQANRRGIMIGQTGSSSVLSMAWIWSHVQPTFQPSRSPGRGTGSGTLPQSCLDRSSLITAVR